MHVMTHELAVALKAALRALNTAPRFAVGDTDSYAIASQSEAALNRASSIEYHFLVIKGQLERAQAEVEEGNPDVGLDHINVALDTVYQLLGVGRKF